MINKQRDAMLEGDDNAGKKFKQFHFVSVAIFFSINSQFIYRRDERNQRLISKALVVSSLPRQRNYAALRVNTRLSVSDSSA